MIWNKNATPYSHTNIRYDNVFEYMFIFSKGKLKTFNPINDKLNSKFGAKTFCKSGNRLHDGTFCQVKKKNEFVQEFGIRTNVWNIAPVVSNKERTGHPAQFPIRLATDHILSWSNEGDLVFDPFLGSGTTAFAALNNNRNFIGCDISEKYVEMAKNRVKIFDFVEGEKND